MNKAYEFNTLLLGCGITLDTAKAVIECLPENNNISEELQRKSATQGFVGKAY